MTIATDKYDAATVRALLERQAAAHEDAVYAVFPQTGTRLSFGGLLKSAQRLAHYLAKLGAEPGERVAFLLPNGLQAVQLFVGIQAAGAVAVPLSLLAQAQQLAFVLEHAAVQRVFVAHEQRALVEAAVALLPTRQLQVIGIDPDLPAPWETGAVGESRDVNGGTLPDASAVSAQAERTAWPWPPRSAREDSLLMYTSGTTGRPKGVRLSGENLLAGARFVSEAHALGPSDRVLAVLPLYHINAQVVMVLATLWHGGSLVMPPRFSVSTFWKLAKEHRCTWLNVVPTMVAYLLDGSVRKPVQEPVSEGAAAVLADAGALQKSQGEGAAHHLRFCRSASAPLAPELQLEFERRFGIGIIETMGLTETAAPCFSNPMEPALRRIGSPGKPVGNRARIADPATGAVLPAGEVGEIQIHGPNVTTGYLDAPEENAKAFTADGWLRTGDLGFRDADGYYFVTGRIKELIIKGGENIAPREIDEALLAHAGVLEAASVGVPDRQYGQQIEAAVVLRPMQAASGGQPLNGETPSEEALRQWCAGHIGWFKTPQRIYFVDELPKGPSGKVQRLRLPEFFGQQNG